MSCKTGINPVRPHELKGMLCGVRVLYIFVSTLRSPFFYYEKMLLEAFISRVVGTV
jgi:hypothetical protein